MKLVTFLVVEQANAQPAVGALVDGQVINLTQALAGLRFASEASHPALASASRTVPPDMIQFLAGGDESLQAAQEALAFAMNEGTFDDSPVSWPLEKVQLLAPVPRPNSIRDTLSFENHMKNFEKRTGRPTPPYWYKSPVYYKGNPCSVVGTDTDVIWPYYTKKFDYELEYGIVIGRQGKNIAVEDAADYIGGYTIFNDFSARDVIQNEVTVFLGPAKAKDMDTGNAIGPCLVTPDEIGSRSLHMTARINGEVWSEGYSNDMYWSFADIIAHVSKEETIYPGDFIGSGTVANGCGDEMDRWIQPGDVIELEVEGIGVLRNRVIRSGASKG